MDSNCVEEIDCASFFDHFDDLIDFPPENECDGGSSGDGECLDFPSILNESLPDSDHIFSAGNSHSASDLSAELSVPYEDIVQLEWLSTFVEESFSGGGLTFNPSPPSNDKKFPMALSPILVLESVSNRSSSSSNSSGSSCSGGKRAPPLSPSQRGPQKARSKRPRPVAFNPRPSMQLIEAPVLESFGDSPPKKRNLPKPTTTEKKKKKIKFSMPTLPNPIDSNNQDDQPAQPVRKCMHCEITKTPQWRAGPMGPKTLCNACGVRYKSGRLFPEYRPAASPTFVPSLHSNSHKKVVEMRTKVAAPIAPPEVKSEGS